MGVMKNRVFLVLALFWILGLTALKGQPLRQRRNLPLGSMGNPSSTRTFYLDKTVLLDTADMRITATEVFPCRFFDLGVKLCFENRSAKELMIRIHHVSHENPTEPALSTRIAARSIVSDHILFLSLPPETPPNWDKADLELAFHIMASDTGKTILLSQPLPIQITSRTLSITPNPLPPTDSAPCVRLPYVLY